MEEIKFKIQHYKEHRQLLNFNKGVAIKLGFDEQANIIGSELSLVREFIEFLEKLDAAIPDEKGSE